MSPIDTLYQTIKDRLTVDHLKKITVDIIDLYKKKNFNHLKKYVSVLGIETQVQNAKLFSVLIKKFHPDRLSFILNEADQCFADKDFNALTRLHDSYFFTIAPAVSTPDFDVEYEEEHVFDEDDFGYRETDLADMERYAETDLDFGEEEHGFLEALHRHFLGNLDVAISEADLMNLEGELDLSDYDIEDLRGVEHCVYLNELNLSNNRIEKVGGLAALVDLYYLYLSNDLIENIGPLESLTHLRELDISFNNIADISVLEKLDGLEYVNLLGNPVRDFSVVDRLMKKGIIVIFEGNILV